VEKALSLVGRDATAGEEDFQKVVEFSLHNESIVAYTGGMEDCVFCKIIAGAIPAEKVYEDERFVAFLDIKPLHVGHTLLVSKKHYRNLFDMPAKLLREVGPVLQKLATAIQSSTKADGINIGWNNEGAAGQLIFHSHVHIMPRYKDDGHVHWGGKEDVSPTELSTAAATIRAELANPPSSDSSVVK